MTFSISHFYHENLLKIRCVDSNFDEDNTVGSSCELNK
jgi:hypothetical protein